MRHVIRLLFLICLATPAAAQTIRVTTGEHDTFTRLVLSLPQGAEWEFGTTDDGYAFRLPGRIPRWEIGSVFDRIPRDRLASITVDPDGSSLRLVLGCACHALPFEFRPGVIVIDLRDGQPPAGSAFEQRLDTAASVVEPPPAAPRPRPRPTVAPAFDWVRLALDESGPALSQAPSTPALPSLPDPAMQALQAELLEGFARAASEGLIDPVTRPPASGTQSTRPAPTAPTLRIGASLDARTGLSPPRGIAASGADCPATDSLQLEDWGTSAPVSVQFAAAMADLVGEFDQPTEEAVARAVRFHLFLGFGAEGRALLAAFPIDHPDRLYWLSLGRILDGDPDPQGAFRGLAGCDGPAALWATLADPTLPDREVDKKALLRTFSSLPAHLRRLVGPPLIDRFLQADDRATASTLNDMLGRLPGPPDARQQIAAARLADSLGSAPQAQTMLEEVLADPGPAQAEALVALVDLHLAEARPLPPTVAQSLEAFLSEPSDSTGISPLARAHVLSLALSGQFDRAFAALPAAPTAQGDLWSLLAKGPDEAILLHAIGADPTPFAEGIRTQIAERLAALGFPQEAAKWSARLVLLPTEEGAAYRKAILSRSWAELGPEAPAPWQELAGKIDPSEVADSPPLARGRSLADESAQTRAAVEALLGSLPDP